VDVGSPGEVPETDAPATHQIPISVSGNVPGKIRIFVVDWSTFATTTRLITLPPGVGSVNVPIRVSGDDTYGYGGQYSVLAEAINGTVVGAYEGDLKVVEDEPAPVITVTPIADQVTEGKTLKWRLNLSAAAGVNLLLPLIFLPPTGAELSTTDLPAAWVRSNLNIEPRPSRVLSRTDSMILLDSPAGTRQVDVVTPTVKDVATEGAEQVRYRILPFDWLFGVNPTVPPDGPELVGTVTDAS
jgi:hypothetical protein